MHHDTRARGESSPTGRAPPAHGTVRIHEGSGEGVTLEEGLIALLAMVAGILLFVGLAQALDARPPRRRRRRSVSGADASAALAPRAPYTGPERRRSPRPGSRQRVRAAAPEVPPPFAPAPVETAAPQPATELSVPTEETPLVQVSAPPPPLPIPLASLPSDPAAVAVERALTLQGEGRHSEVVGTALAQLGSPAGSEVYETPFSRASLWALVGVSRHALGDTEGTQKALEAAVREAPNGVAEGCPERITAVAVDGARQLLGAADSMSRASTERVAFLRMSVLWLEWRIVASPATEEISVVLDKAREALWEGYVLAGRGL